METYNLKDGTSIDVIIESFSELEEINRHNSHEEEYWPGFAYIGDRIIREARTRSDKASRYIDAKNLTPLEVQEEKHERNSDYHKVLLALYNNEIVGTMLLEWNNGMLDPKEEPFWRSDLNFVDVREDFQHKGVAKVMYHSLDNAQFIKNHILLRTCFSQDGKRFLKGKVAGGYLKARDYALCSEYCAPKSPPLECGIFCDKDL